MRKTATLFFASLLSLSAFSQSKALNFDGIDDCVSFPEKAGVLTGAYFTIEAWVKPTGPVNDMQVLLVKTDQESGTGIDFFFTPGDPDLLNVTFQVADGSGGEIMYELPTSWLNQWHHVAVTYNGSRLQLYVDGQIAGPYSSVDITGSLAPYGSSVNIGAIDGSNGLAFNGTMDELRIWNVARTQTQLQANMNKEIAANSAGLTAYYRFNQGVAGGNNVSISTVTDAVTTPNNGSMINFTKTGSSSNFTAGNVSLVLLPVKDATFVAVKKETGVQLGWSSIATEGGSLFTVERSSNGIDFSVIGTVKAMTGPVAGPYSFTDAQPLAPISYYRIKTVDADRYTSYSKTIAVKMAGGAVSLQAYPNPVRSNLQLQLTAPKGQVTVQVNDLSGRTLQTLQLTSDGATLYTSVDVSLLPKGIYVVRANNESTLFIKQ